MTQKQITLYFRPMCGFCASAERLLSAKGVPYEKINIWTTPGAKEAMVAKSGGQTTVPQIFADEAYIGDCSGLHNLEATGKLDAVLGI